MLKMSRRRTGATLKAKRSSQFSKHFPRQPKSEKIIYTKHPCCPSCGDTLEIASIRPQWFPYIHVDVLFICPTELTEFVFGIPQSRDSGLALHVFDTNPIEAVKKFADLGECKCPFVGHGEMLPTKIFGDWVPDTEDVEYQWKCSVCYLTQHEKISRDFPHGEKELTDEEMEVIKKRLQDMGYIA